MSKVVVFTYILIALVALILERRFRLAKSTDGVPIVEIGAGEISGFKTSSREGRNIFAYQGIPFADPPIGDLRFKRPRPYSASWEGVLEAVENPPKCTQLFKIDSYYTTWRGQEDCLYLNVYVPETEGKKDLPVMVFIHGGGFTFGDGSDSFYGPQNLLDKDVILVVLQYRLGPFGNLNLGVDEISGNQAMWDQREALKWVQRNIKVFGGDPNRVTLFGQSAGSIFVMHHLASEGSKGLFHRAIAQSGTTFGASSNLDAKRPMTDFHKDYISAVGCRFNGPKNDWGKEIVSCLQSKTLQEILLHTHMFDKFNFMATGNLIILRVVYCP